jgi:hypothetical protein
MIVSEQPVLAANGELIERTRCVVVVQLRSAKEKALQIYSLLAHGYLDAYADYARHAVSPSWRKPSGAAYISLKRSSGVVCL